MLLQTGAQVANDAVQGILSRVDQLAAKLGTTAGNVWNIYLAQAKVEAIRDTVVGVPILLLGLAALCFSFFSQDSDEDARGMSFFFGLVVCAAAIGFFLYPAIGEWFNPAYWAFQHLTEDLKKLL